MLSGDLSVLILKQLLIDAIDSGGWGPVDIRLFKILLMIVSHLMNKQDTDIRVMKYVALRDMSQIPNPSTPHTFIVYLELRELLHKYTQSNSSCEMSYHKLNKHVLETVNI